MTQESKPQSKFDLETFREQVADVYDDCCWFTIHYLGNLKHSAEGIAFGFLKTAALIATRTFCSKEIFLKLAAKAFDEEEQAMEAKKLLKGIEEKITKLENETDKNWN